MPRSAHSDPARRSRRGSTGRTLRGVLDSSSTPRSRTRRVTIAEAARILGVSGETVRRRIHAGQLEGIREVRPQGSAWSVVLPVGTPVVSTRGGHATPRVELDQEPKHSTRDVVASTTPLHVEATETTGLSGDVLPSRLLVGSIARLIAELAEVRVVSDRRADRVAELERENGRLTAELAALDTTHATLIAAQQPVEASGAPQPVTPTVGPLYGRLRALAVQGAWPR